MESSTPFSERKSELEAKIKSLEEEKIALIAEIDFLREKLSTLELERRAKTLEDELQALRGQKTSLEEKIAEFEAPETQVVEQSPPTVAQ